MDDRPHDLLLGRWRVDGRPHDEVREHDADDNAHNGKQRLVADIYALVEPTVAENGHHAVRLGEERPKSARKRKVAEPYRDCAARRGRREYHDVYDRVGEQAPRENEQAESRARRLDDLVVAQHAHEHTRYQGDELTERSDAGECVAHVVSGRVRLLHVVVANGHLQQPLRGYDACGRRRGDVENNVRVGHARNVVVDNRHGDRLGLLIPVLPCEHRSREDILRVASVLPRGAHRWHHLDNRRCAPAKANVPAHRREGNTVRFGHRLFKVTKADTPSVPVVDNHDVAQICRLRIVRLEHEHKLLRVLVHRIVNEVNGHAPHRRVVRRPLQRMRRKREVRPLDPHVLCVDT
eukprot:Opistho-1_new@93537